MTLTVVALGGNALLRRGEPLDPAVQDRNVAAAARALLGAVDPEEQLVITHGNGPQVGLLAVADAARLGGHPFPLDVLDAESEGMIGYLLARHLYGASQGRAVASLLTQIVVDPDDPAFDHATKPIGATYRPGDAEAAARDHGWTMAPDGMLAGAAVWRRVVASPTPTRIVELPSIRALLEAGAIVVCAGGGGVPVAEADDGLVGVEAVVDKDATTALLATALGADRLVLLTDVDAVIDGWGTPDARPIELTTPASLAAIGFAEGSMGPKVRAACRYVDATGHPAAIGSLDHAAEVLAGRAGTRIVPGPPPS